MTPRKKKKQKQKNFPDWGYPNTPTHADSQSAAAYTYSQPTSSGHLKASLQLLGFEVVEKLP